MHTLFGITLVLYLLKLSAGKGLCELQLLDIFCGIAAGFAYRQMIVFACKMPGVSHTYDN